MGAMRYPDARGHWWTIGAKWVLLSRTQCDSTRGSDKKANGRSGKSNIRSEKSKRVLVRRTKTH